MGVDFDALRRLLIQLAVVHQPVGVTGTGPLDGTEMVAGNENTVKGADK